LEVAGDEDVTLAAVLEAAGLRKGQRIMIDVDGTRLRIPRPAATTAGVALADGSAGQSSPVALHSLYRLRRLPETPAVVAEASVRYTPKAGFQVFATPAEADARYFPEPTPPGHVAVRYHPAIARLRGAKPIHVVPIADLIDL
jgi:hypothetical protein